MREYEPREEALAEFDKDGDFMKTHFVTKFTEPGAQVSFYRNGKFVDFCRGPHVPSTGRVKAVKVMSISGAYWLGNEKNPQLQRIYGTAFFSKKDLDDYLDRIEEAKRRDHRRLGKELELFTVNEDVGAGLPLWLPKGATIRRLLEEYILDLERKDGYEHVYTPDLAKVDLYIRSGHWEHYHEDMFPPMDLETEQMVLRPMNCPHHILIYESKQRSYRELPVKHCRTGHDVSLRALGRAERVEPGTLHDAQRRAYFLHAGADQGRVLRSDAAGGAGVRGPGDQQIQLPAFAARPGEQREVRGQRRDVGPGRASAARGDGFAGAEVSRRDRRGGVLRAEARYPACRRDGARGNLLDDPGGFPSAQPVRAGVHGRGRQRSTGR